LGVSTPNGDGTGEQDFPHRKGVSSSTGKTQNRGGENKNRTVGLVSEGGKRLGDRKPPAPPRGGTVAQGLLFLRVLPLPGGFFHRVFARCLAGFSGPSGGGTATKRRKKKPLAAVGLKQLASFVGNSRNPPTWNFAAGDVVFAAGRVLQTKKKPPLVRKRDRTRHRSIGSGFCLARALKGSHCSVFFYRAGRGVCAFHDRILRAVNGRRTESTGHETEVGPVRAKKPPFRGGEPDFFAVSAGRGGGWIGPPMPKHNSIWPAFNLTIGVTDGRRGNLASRPPER